MTTKRPPLDRSLAVDIFLDWYWLKAELIQFCSQEQLSAQGSKAEITDRIATYLRSGERVRPAMRPKASSNMPVKFELYSVIEPGWRCTENLRTFLKIHLGAGFKFNSVMRDYVLHRPGCTLADAIDAYKANKLAPRNPDIPTQFEYNRFMRSFRQANSTASHDEVIKSWRKHRDTPRSCRMDVGMASTTTDDETRGRAWWATLSSADRVERQDELRRQLDGGGIEHPTDERGWIMALWGNENA